MINISFDRPELLLIAIPLLALVFIPFLIAIRKENNSKSAVASLIIHTVIALCITLVAAGVYVQQIVTETEVIVLADASYSADKNLELVDEYVDAVKDALPDNSRMGVVAFGKDSRLIVPLGSELTSVKDSGIDNSGTDIKQALEYASTLFSEGVVKRIVIITDGKQNSGSTFEGVVGTIDTLTKSGVYIDAMYLDDNLTDSDREVQLSGVDFNASTYINHKTTADVLIQSSTERANAKVTLSEGGVEIDSTYVLLTKGYNVINFELPTDVAGRFDYTVSVSATTPDGENADTSDKNNSYTFTQTVSGELSVLLITSKRSDLDRARELYGANATIDSYIDDPAVPCTVESLIKYDEIILSDVDVRDLDNVISFISALDTVVSRYGKSLVTFGDTKIQNQTDDVLGKLENMLPVNYGNDDQDPKLVCIVMDTSRSMEAVYKLEMAKAAATQMLEILNDHDFVTIIGFSGNFTTIWPSSPVGGSREEIANAIKGIEPTQGTVLAKGMKKAYEEVMKSSLEDRQLFLISDGRTWANEEDDAVKIAEMLAAEGVPTSVLNTATREDGDPSASAALKLLKDISEVGLGNYYYASSPENLTDIMLADIADDMTDTVIEGDTPVSVKLRTDKVMDGIESGLPSLGGFIYSKTKKSATTVLSTYYTKSSGNVIEVPIYSYWGYGNGRVASFTSSLSGSWSDSWRAGAGNVLMSNIATTNVPESKTDYPFELTLEENGSMYTVTLEPETLDFDAEATLVLTMPDGTVIEAPLTFNSESYTYEFEASEVGKYSIDISYSYLTRVYTASTYLDIPYVDEYDSFTVFNVSDIHKLIRNRGGVFEGGVIALENDENDVATYTLYISTPIMAVAIVLFIISVIIRKLRWADILSLFGTRDRKKGAAKR